MGRSGSVSEGGSVGEHASNSKVGDEGGAAVKVGSSAGDGADERDAGASAGADERDAGASVDAFAEAITAATAATTIPLNG
jgi:hypothetical protein